MWRYSANPIIGRYALSTSNSIFNSAVVPFKKGKYNYAGVFRCDDTNRLSGSHVGDYAFQCKYCDEDFYSSEVLTSPSARPSDLTE